MYTQIYFVSIDKQLFICYYVDDLFWIFEYWCDDLQVCVLMKLTGFAVVYTLCAEKSVLNHGTIEYQIWTNLNKILCT